MRRQLNNAYLLQTFLMVCLIGLLVFLVLRGASPLVFSLVFLTGILLAALPGIYTGFVLPRRESLRAEQVRRSGRPVRGRVLQDGAQVLSEFRRTTMGHKGVVLLLDVPVQFESSTQPAVKGCMKVDINALPGIKTGMLVAMRCDPANPEYIVLDEIIGSQSG